MIRRMTADHGAIVRHQLPIRIDQGTVGRSIHIPPILGARIGLRVANPCEMSTKSREVIWGSCIMGPTFAPRAQGKPPGLPSRKPTGLRLKPGPSAWRAVAVLLNRHRQSGSASTAEWVGWSSNVTAMKPGLACRRTPSADTPTWKLESSLKCRSCRKGRTAPSVQMDQADQVACDHALQVGDRSLLWTPTLGQIDTICQLR
jgi:hypothetical protein